MQDRQREILNQVASGKISAEEGAARLEALRGDTPVLDAPSRTATEPQGGARPADLPGGRRVRVEASFGGVEVIGDPSVAFVTADGPHRARQDGDTMVIEHAPFGEEDTFSFDAGLGRRVRQSGLEWIGWRRLAVRMNPELPLFVSVQAGNVRIEGVHGPISGDVQAGNCKITDFRAPLNLSVQAGNVTADGRLDGGQSGIHCEMGSVKIGLDRRSNVRIQARTSLGKIAIEGEGGTIGSGGKEVTIGSGAGTLDIESSMGSVKVEVE